MTDVVVRTAEARLVAAARQRTTFERVAREIAPLLGRVWAFLDRRPDLVLRDAEGRRGRNVAIYWDGAGAGSIEVGVEVAHRFDDEPDVVCSATPGGTVASYIHVGPYDTLGDSHAIVRRWCAENGRSIGSPFWEVYDHVDGRSPPQTSVFYLLP